MKLSASHMNARGQGYFMAVSWSFTYIQKNNNLIVTSLVQVSGERLQDQWSSGFDRMRVWVNYAGQDQRVKENLFTPLTIHSSLL